MTALKAGQTLLDDARVLTPADAAKASFTGVSTGADYARATAWAVEQGVTSDTGNNRLSPAQTCTRSQIVDFLYRAFAK